MIDSVLDMLDGRESEAPADELEAITGIRTGNTAPPQDATLARLLPDFHRSDGPDTAGPEGPGGVDPAGFNAALRSMHEPEIIDAKREAATRMRSTCPRDGGRVELTEDDAGAWVAAVNDIRLALGTILETGPDSPDVLPVDHPLAGHLDVYHWLTALQEFLVLLLLGKRI